MLNYHYNLVKQVLKSYLFLTIIITGIGCGQASTENKPDNDIAAANGIAAFDKIEMLEFTFNVQRDTNPASSRHWQWYPKTNEVVFITDSSNTRFVRTDTSTQELKKLNARFTNDEYWLMYPFHLSWDKDMLMTDSSEMMAPLRGEKMQKITTRYNDKAGFTPGDMYEIYVDKDKKIQEWVYYKAGSTEPTLNATWEDYKDFNGLTLAQNHLSKDGKFRIWFTGIQVKK